jgi:hypothetical protein
MTDRDPIHPGAFLAAVMVTSWAMATIIACLVIMVAWDTLARCGGC